MGNEIHNVAISYAHGVAQGIIAKHIKKHNASLSDIDPETGNTIFHIAAKKGDTFLIDAIAMINVNIINHISLEGRTAASIAAERLRNAENSIIKTKCSSILKTLVQIGADLFLRGENTNSAMYEFFLNEETRGFVYRTLQEDKALAMKFINEAAHHNDETAFNLVVSILPEDWHEELNDLFQREATTIIDDETMLVGDLADFDAD